MRGAPHVVATGSLTFVVPETTNVSHPRPHSGNTLSLPAIWRAHRLDTALREAWDAGVVLCGVRAGTNCRLLSP